MKNPVQYLATICLTALSVLSFAQDVINPRTDSITWEYGNIENKKRTETINIQGRFISYGRSGFVWIQNGTDTKYFFDVKAIKGNWSDIKETGKLIYNAVCQGIEGTIRIFKEDRSSQNPSGFFSAR